MFKYRQSLSQSLFIKNRRGERLAALLYKAAARRRERSCGKPGEAGDAAAESLPLVIVCHGFTGSKEGGGRALEMAEELAQRGFNALLFDFAGCGASEGKWEEITLTRHVEDLRDVAAWCRKKGYSKIILIGRSFGGAAALAYAARDREISAVCTWAAPVRLVDLFKGFAMVDPFEAAEDLIPLAGEGEVIYIRRGFFRDLLEHEMAVYASSLAPRPLLIIHGTADEVVPVADARLLYQAAGNPKELALIEGADHRFSNSLLAAWNTFFQWLDHISGQTRQLS